MWFLESADESTTPGLHPIRAVFEAFPLEMRELIHVPVPGIPSQAFLEMKVHNFRLYDGGVISDLLDKGVHILPLHQIALWRISS
jgi:hypothetical protein